MHSAKMARKAGMKEARIEQMIRWQSLRRLLGKEILMRSQESVFYSLFTSKTLHQKQHVGELLDKEDRAALWLLQVVLTKRATLLPHNRMRDLKSFPQSVKKKPQIRLIALYHREKEEGYFCQRFYHRLLN